MAPRTRSQARVEAPTSLFDDLDDDLQNMIVWATTEGGAAKPNAALLGVNKKLRTMVEQTHTWHDEWVDAWLERNKLDRRELSSLELRGGRHHVHRGGVSRTPRLTSSGRWTTMAGRKSRPRRTR